MKDNKKVTIRKENTIQYNYINKTKNISNKESTHYSNLILFGVLNNIWQYTRTRNNNNIYK